MIKEFNASKISEKLWNNIFFRNQNGLYCILMIKKLISMKYKYLVWGVLFVLLQSCLKSDNLNKAIYINLGLTMHDDSENYWIETDAGDKLVPVNYDLSKFSNEDSVRVLVNYSVEEFLENPEEYRITINAIDQVLVKSLVLLNTENRDTLGDDPITMRTIWFSRNYLNIDFEYLGGSKTHYINLVTEEEELANNEPITVEIKHDANDDFYGRVFRGIVSFDLRKLERPGKDSVLLMVKAKGFEGMDFEETGYYVYK